MFCEGKNNIRDLTTTEVNEKYQKKITEKYKLSFCEYLSQLKHPAVGNIFIYYILCNLLL